MRGAGDGGKQGVFRSTRREEEIRWRLRAEEIFIYVFGCGSAENYKYVFIFK